VVRFGCGRGRLLPSRYTLFPSVRTGRNLARSPRKGNLPHPSVPFPGPVETTPKPPPIGMARTDSDDTPMNLTAAALGWVFPGLGHVVLGQVRRGVLAGAGVLLLFFGGLLVGGIDAVDRKEDNLWFIGQAGAGPIAFVASYANEAILKSGRHGELLPMPTPYGTPIDPASPRPTVSTSKGLAHANEFGTFFTFLAGLMNFVVILDALQRRRDEPDGERRKEAGAAA
jgi:hypothetical protein